MRRPGGKLALRRRILLGVGAWRKQECHTPRGLSKAAPRGWLPAPTGGTCETATAPEDRSIEHRSDPMTPPATLTGQDVGEAEGA